jgi:hypothetical protein
VVRNPLALERAQREETEAIQRAAAAAAAAAPTKTASLWDDDDDDTDAGGDADEEQKASTVAAKGQESSALDDLQHLEDNEETLREKWYPSFDNPQFGPADPPVPLFLSEVYQVPASISRYLAPYQPEGIKFMFDKAIANRRGCILGDGTSNTFAGEIVDQTKSKTKATCLNHAYSL